MMDTHSENEPLISCLCITRNKIEYLKRAVACFRGQTYPNKELVIVYEDDDANTVEIAESLRSDDILLVELGASPKLTLGELRNISVEACRGTYFCQWDDDDWYHNQRLEVQMEACRQSCKPANILVNWLMYDLTKHEAYFSFHNMWDGSILCRKDVFKEFKYPSLSKGEDSQFLLKLFYANYLYPVVKPSLYIYVYHGRNTWDREHFAKMFLRSQKLAPGTGQLLREILENQYSTSEASRLLLSPDLLKEIDYFHSFKD